jgi:hypothetical protein
LIFIIMMYHLVLTPNSYEMIFIVTISICPDFKV